MHPLARAYGITVADQAYSGLQDMARQADNDRDFMRAGEIREALNEIDRYTAEELLALTTRHHRMVEPQPPASLSGTAKAEQSYHAIEDMFRRAAESGDSERAYEITRQALELIDQVAAGESRLRSWTGHAAMAKTVRPLRSRLQSNHRWRSRRRQCHSLDGWIGPISPARHTPSDPGCHSRVRRTGGRARPCDRCPRSAPGVRPPRVRSLAEAAGTDAGDLGRWWLDQPASAPGTTAVHPVAAEAIVTPSLGETSSFWLQPVDPVPAPGTVPFDSGLLHAGETVQPPPLTTAPSSTAPGALYHVPSWVEDDFAVERALIAGNLPPGFDASPLIVEAASATGLPEIDRLLEATEGISHPAPPQPPSAPGRIGVGTGVDCRAGRGVGHRGGAPEVATARSERPEGAFDRWG